MKFAIRDDDLNYFYTPEFIENNFKDIWNICPISMSVIPFVKGNWLKNVNILEKLGPNNVSLEIINQIRKDNQVYDIASNQELVMYIKNKIREGKIYLTIHGIHHRNEDAILPKIKDNFAIGAEFYTNRDLTHELKIAKEHIEKVFSQKITVFIPPQNIYSKKGLKAIIDNNLNICSNLPSVKKVWNAIKIIGVPSYITLLKFKLKSKSKTAPYPYVIKVSKIKIVQHRSLQPGTNVDNLYEDFEYIYSKYKDGCFVLATHSYGFNYLMKSCKKTMGEVFREFLLYVQKKDNIKFVTLGELLE